MICPFAVKIPLQKKTPMTDSIIYDSKFCIAMTNRFDEYIYAQLSSIIKICKGKKFI